MNGRTGRVFGWIVWATCLVLVIAGIALVLPHRRLPILNVPQQWLSAFVALTFGTVGAFLADRRPRHPVPWIFLAIGLSQSLAVFAVYGNAAVADGSRSTWANILAWLETWVWAPGFVLIPTLLLQLFPTGRPLSERWRWLVRTTLLGLAAAMVGVAFHRQSVGRTASVNVPVGYRSPVPTSHALDFLAGIGLVALVVSVIASVISIVLRYRRSRGEERDQLKWFATAAVGTVVLLTGAASLPPTAPAASRAVVFVGVPLLPVATAIAVLRYRLYDIDLVINKTLVYGLLAAFITAVYVGIVVGIGQAVGSKRNLGLSILATAVVAVGFQPVRDRIQHLANRLVYGKRATPYEVLSEFSERMSGSFATEDLLPRMARILAEGTGAIRADVWLHVGNTLHPEASWPSGGEPPEPIAASDAEVPTIEGIDRLLPVRHGEEMLGALSVAKARGDPLRPAEEKLMEDLASGAGLVLRNVRLTAELLARLEELKRSRQRIVAAQDEERRRLERNLHDGAQQQLVALQVRLSLAERLAEEDCRIKDQLSSLKAEAGEALENLRDLARGIYPPLLADQGLAAALSSQARKAAIPVLVEAEGISRYPQEQEAAVYFCCLEALQNVAKYAGATQAVIRLSTEDRSLAFTVTDDGAGFDTSKTFYGTGLQGMADRLSALGGTLEVRSRPGEGTTVEGRLPVGAEQAAG